MRILIVGGSGLIGAHVRNEATKRGHEVIATYRNVYVVGLAKLDLGDEVSMRKTVADFKPDWVVHSAGFTWADGCELDPDRARRENCDQPAALARACVESGSRFAYFSSTYVFDGNDGPYSETDKPNPINVYGRSKWAAEQIISQITSGEALILRVICVWGLELQRKNFVYQSIKALQEGRRIKLPSDQLGNPSWAGDIARWLLSLMERQQLGCWNLAGREMNCSRVEWFEKIRNALVERRLLLNGGALSFESMATHELGQTAPRPLNAGAKTLKIQGFEALETRDASSLDPILDETY